jgi:hypothetical protein
MNRLALFAVVLLPFLLTRCAALYPVHEHETRSEAGFLRVEQLPEGAQANMVFGQFAADVRNVTTVQWIYGVSFSIAWDACNAAAGRFDKTGKRPVVKVTRIDENSGRIQNGQAGEDARDRPAADTWADEFIIEADSVSPERTRVIVSRRIVWYDGITGPGEMSWQTHWSNGKIEWWLLTRIQDEINEIRKRKSEQASVQPVAAPTSPPEEPAPPVAQKKSLPAGTVLVETIRIPVVEMVKAANVRAKATTKSAVIAILNKGFQVEVEGKLREWYRIKLPSGKIGWIHKALVRQVE